MIPTILTQRLVVVTGKGGVGKTTVAAMVGRSLAAAGRRVLVMEIDPRENAHQMLALPPTGGDIVSAGSGLWLQNLKPRSVLDALVRKQLRVGPLARRVLASRVYHHFAEGAPGLEELAILGHALSCLRGLTPGAPVLDAVVLDAPATGHGVSLLLAPGLVSEVIDHGPFGRLAAESAEFVADTTACGALVVCTAEEMPVQEALELTGRLRSELARDPVLVAVNRLYPSLPPSLETDDLPADSLRELWRRRRAVNEREMRRLSAAFGGPVVRLPLLPLERGPELIAALRRAAGERARWN